eukprot:TRINITY_DN1648_c0_g1_i1.p1 TRINITY_DN1648_c0_g1~~TRINITY_DN1648_c0_g1_i1.p1  ORF type:complete len:500 (+),score=88.37 TRINITY_DN1648_c0_g1_i1:39-1538(+)
MLRKLIIKNDNIFKTSILKYNTVNNKLYCKRNDGEKILSLQNLFDKCEDKENVTFRTQTIQRIKNRIRYKVNPFYEKDTNKTICVPSKESNIVDTINLNYNDLSVVERQEYSPELFSWKLFYDNPNLPLHLDIGSGKGLFGINFSSLKNRKETKCNYLGIDIRTDAISSSYFQYSNYLLNLKSRKLFFQSIITFEELVNQYYKLFNKDGEEKRIELFIDEEDRMNLTNALHQNVLKLDTFELKRIQFLLGTVSFKIKMIIEDIKINDDLKQSNNSDNDDDYIDEIIQSFNLVDSQIVHFDQTQINQVTDNVNSILNEVNKINHLLSTIISKYNNNNDDNKNIENVIVTEDSVDLNRNICYMHTNIISSLDDILRSLQTNWNKHSKNNLNSKDIGSLQSVSILFPDPFPKKRQAKRRFLNSQFFDTISKYLVKNGKIILKTDSSGMFTHTTELLHHYEDSFIKLNDLDMQTDELNIPISNWEQRLPKDVPIYCSIYKKIK